MARIALEDCRCCAGAGAGADIQVRVVFREEDSYLFCKDSTAEARKLPTLITGCELWERHGGCEAFKKKKRFDIVDCEEPKRKATAEPL